MNLEIPIKAAITVIAVVLLLIRKNVPGIELDNVDFALLIVGAFPWLPSIISSAKLPGGFEFEFNRVKERQEEQESKIAELIREVQKRQTEDINFLRVLVVNTSIQEYGIQHLRNLMSPEPVPYQPNPGLESNLHRLLESGLIERKPGKGIRTLMREFGDIKDHFQITESGRRTLSAWEHVRQERSVMGNEEASSND
jgi:hypothetical protein